MKSKSNDAPIPTKEQEATTLDEALPRPADGPSHEQIQHRAFEIHIERGGLHGHDLEDWLQAEEELRAKHQAG